MAAAVADHAAGFGIAAVSQVHHVAQVPDWAALLLKRADQGPATGDRFQAAGVAAAARHPRGGGGLVVAEFSRRFDGAALQRPAGDNAGAETGRRLDYQ